MKDWLLARKKIFEALFLLVLLSGLVTFVMNFSVKKFPTDLKAGGIATFAVRADRDYEITDEEATTKLREEKLSALLPVFDWDDRSIGGIMIVVDKEILSPWLQKGVMVRMLSQPTQEPKFFKNWSQVLTLEEGRKRARPSLQKTVQPNFVFNQQETETRKQKVVEEIKDVVIKVQRGESILRVGDRIAPWHAMVIQGIQREMERRQIGYRWVGTWSFTFLFIGLLLLAGKSLGRQGKRLRRDFIFQGTLLLLFLTFERVFLYFSTGLRELLPFDTSFASFYSLIPVAAGSIIVCLVLSRSAAFLFTIVLSFLAALSLENSLVNGLYYLCGGLAAVWWSGTVRSRFDLLKVGLKVGGVNVVSLVVINLAISTSPTAISFAHDLATLLPFAFGGGIFSAMMTLIFLPLYESLFNYLTPIKLLEFGSLNHPLLREMIVRAPGTYHHSHMVGTLAEAACESIGADALFARVACYFHDIGKMAKPSYFIENQRQGEDRHLGLAPSMSALIISSHVKEGIDLARKHKLPQKIIDIIPQHQGTKLITYFYSKAKESEKRDLYVVDERHYRYPGPRPQTREAGVVLLADTVEAATRALKDRTPTRLTEVVRNMINKNFIDGQLDECDLTLKDLENIGRSFVRILMGVYHQRVEYPQIPEKDSKVSILSPNVDKYTQSSPLKEDSLSEDVPLSSKNLSNPRPEEGRH